MAGSAFSNRTKYGSAIRIGRRRYRRKPAKNHRETGFVKYLLKSLWVLTAAALAIAAFLGTTVATAGLSTQTTAHSLLYRPSAGTLGARIDLHSHPNLIPCLVGVLVMSWVGCMFPGGGGNTSNGGLQRMPPSWNPDRESTYPFRSWMQDLLAWSIMNNNMDQAQQAAAIRLSVGGAARELLQSMSIEELTRGGPDANGRHMDPVTYIVTHLANYFAPLGRRDTYARHA